jgi:hypothetical protein
MRLRLALLAFGCAACGGGVRVDADIVDATCQITGTGIAIDAEYDVVLEVGERLEIEVVIPGILASSSVDEWECADWTTTLSGDLELGCERDAGTQADRQVVSDQRTEDFDGSVTSVVITPVVVLNNGGHPGDGFSVDCTP